MGCNTFMSEHKVGGGNAETLERYVLATGANEEPPELVEGDIKDIKRNDLRAQLHGHAYGNLHFSLTSDREITRKDIKAYKRNIERSYGISLKDHPHVLVQHKKPRADGTGYEYHFHLVVAYTSRSGKAANIHAAVKKNELVGRLTEFELGHPLQKGKHNLSVRKAAVALDLKDFVAAVDAAKICEGHRAEAKYGSKQKEKAKRLGFNLRDFAAAIRAIPEGQDRFQKVKEIVAHFGAEVGKSDRRNALTVRVDGKEVVANFNRLLGLRAADTPALIAALNAAETAAAHTFTSNIEETENGRGIPTRTSGTGTPERTADAGAKQRNADARRNSAAHVAHTQHRGEAGPSPATEARIGGRPDRNRGPSESSAGRGERPDRSSKLSALGKLIRAQIADTHGQYEVPSEPRPYQAGSPDAASAGTTTRRGLNFLEAAKMQNALAASGVMSKKLLKTETRHMAEVPPARFELARPRPALSHLQAAKLSAALAGKPRKVLKKANKMAMGKVPMPAFSLSQKAFLNHLQAAKLAAAVEAKFGDAIRDAARKPLLKKVETEGYRHAIPSGPDLPAKALPPLNTKALREVFAHVKTLSGQAQMDAVAAILQAHGLRLTAGAKPGVIAIERPLGNGTSEFVGSLDRFAGVKSSSHDCADLIAEITRKLNVAEAPEANLISKDKEAKDGLVKRENGSKIWREYAGRISATAEKAVAGVRAAAAAQRDAERDQGRHGEHKKPAGNGPDAIAGKGRPDNRASASNDQNDGKTGRAGRHNTGPTSDHHSTGDGGELDAPRDSVDRREGRPLTAVERMNLKAAVALYGDSIKLYSTPIGQPEDPKAKRPPLPKLPAVNLAPRGQVRPRVPSAPPAARQSAFRRGLSASGGGGSSNRHQNSDFGGSGGNDRSPEAKDIWGKPV